MDIEQFSELGPQIEESWRRVNYDEERFADIAAKVLSNASLDSQVNLDAVLDWLVGPASDEQGATATFSDLPLLIYRSPEFHVELLLWTSGTTSIHQHGFTGAFRVFAGSSIHSRYKFNLHHRVNSRLQVGDVQLQSIELLRQGDSRAIAAGAGFTHSLFHLDRLTVSIVARTTRAPLAQPHMTLHPPHFAIDAHGLARDPVAAQVVRCLLVMKDTGNRDIVQALAEQFPRLDFSRVFQICMKASRALDDYNQQLIELIRHRYGDLADRLRASQLYEQELQALIKLRRNVADEELRFFSRGAAMRADSGRHLSSHQIPLFRHQPRRQSSRVAERAGHERSHPHSSRTASSQGNAARTEHG